jgi:hypothetical protein
MNITTTSQAAQASADVTTHARAFRRAVASTIAAAALIAGAVVGVATPAQAAPAPSASVRTAVASTGTASVCFKSSFNLYGQTFWGAYDRDVIVDVLVNGVWHQYWILTPNINGCLTQRLWSGATYRFRVYHYEANRWYVGRSGAGFLAPNGYLNFGTVYV